VPHRRNTRPAEPTQKLELPLKNLSRPRGAGRPAAGRFGPAFFEREPRCHRPDSGIRRGRARLGALRARRRGGSAAGYGLIGAIEEITGEQARANMETNFFGPLSVVQATLPRLREQGGGHLLPVSSLGGVAALPTFFQPTKWAVEGMAESLAQEVQPHGIKVTIIEPGAYGTTFFDAGSLHQANPLPAYATSRTQLQEQANPRHFGNPHATTAAFFAAVDADRPPLRLILGSTSLPLIEKAYAARLHQWREWSAVSDAAP
jgi:hypothetical protein